MGPYPYARTGAFDARGCHATCRMDFGRRTQLKVATRLYMNVNVNMNSQLISRRHKAAINMAGYLDF